MHSGKGHKGASIAIQLPLPLTGDLPLAKRLALAVRLGNSD